MATRRNNWSIVKPLHLGVRYPHTSASYKGYLLYLYNLCFNCWFPFDALCIVPVANIRRRFPSPFREMGFFSPSSPTIVLPEQLMAPDEEALWFLSPLFRHLCIDNVCPQGPGGSRLTEIIKSKYVSPAKGGWTFDMLIRAFAAPVGETKSSRYMKVPRAFIQCEAAGDGGTKK